VHIVNLELRTDERIRGDMGERLREERKRLGLSQTEMALIAGGSLRAQQTYEAGKRTPTAEYLAALVARGVDVTFVLTGARKDRDETIDSLEAALLCAFRALGSTAKAAIVHIAEMAALGEAKAREG
jgi:transcriptional regulator with XRE-family HTH domain